MTGSARHPGSGVPCRWRTSCGAPSLANGAGAAPMESRSVIGEVGSYGPRAPRVHAERGSVLPIVMVVLLCLLAAGLSAALVGSAEVALASAWRESLAADSVAEAFLERALADLRRVPQWDLVLSGDVRSPVVDGPPGGIRQVPFATATIDLDALRNIANCGHQSACTVSEMNAFTGGRPWGANNPRWVLFAHAPAGALLPAGRIVAPFYGLVLVADDGGEEDGDPQHDGPPGSTGSGVIWLRAIVIGAAGTRSSVEVAAERPAISGMPAVGWPLRLLSWVKRPATTG